MPVNIGVTELTLHLQVDMVKWEEYRCNELIVWGRRLDGGDGCFVFGINAGCHKSIM